MLFWRGGNCKGNPLYHTVSPSPTFYFNFYTSTLVPEASPSIPKLPLRFRSLYFEFRHLVTFRNYVPLLAFSLVTLLPSLTSVSVLSPFVFRFRLLLRFRFSYDLDPDSDFDPDFDFDPAGILVYVRFLYSLYSFLVVPFLL